MRGECRYRQIKGQISFKIMPDGEIKLYTYKKRKKRRRKYNCAPRKSWEDYGISKERYRELTAMICGEEYASLALSVALRTNGMIAEYILLSIIENRSYDGIEYAEGLGRIPCGRTDFYGWRRYFYHLFDLELRRIGNGVKN